MLELREIRCVLALSEQLHFGRTAHELRMSQSRVSRTVREAEQKVGGRLFERTSRNVRLTALGAELIDRLRPLYEQMANAYADVVTRTGGASGTIRLGFIGIAGGVHAARLIRTAQDALPDCRLILREVPCGDPLALLHRGQVDAVVVQLPVETRGVTIGPVVGREPRVLAVAPDHRLAGRDSVSVKDIADETVLQPVGAAAEYWRDIRLFWATPPGRGQQHDQEVRTCQEVLSLVAAGQGVAPLTESTARRHARPDTVFVPLDLPDAQVALVWRSMEENELVRALAACGLRMSEEPVLARA